MTTDLSKRIEEQVALARAIEEKRKQQNEVAIAAERADFLAEYAPRLAALRDALPDWAHPYIEAPSDWEGYPVIRLPELPVVFCYVKRSDDKFQVEFDLTVYDRWDDSFMPSRQRQSMFALAVESAVDAQRLHDEVMATKQLPVQPKPSKWANLDPTRKALEALDAGEYGEAGAFAMLAVARELRALNGWMAAASKCDAVAYPADEPDPDQAGTY